ncbi:MAG: hydrogenase iron-sulfur subunit [Deltaproteobacteria bacterium]|nr:hydrogenase iron-sulfur subunit [Deltaproteobacteria bacterium]MBN2670938.1 hydrogenase iron-sulfur subunit [Deltaproteobacteria bacterium]
MAEVKLLTFVCNWCSYGGADQAGGLKIEYPSGVRLVKVMCSGRVDPQLILQGFRKGADGVLVLGCHPGDCHYKSGNYSAQKRMLLLEPLLAQFGIESDRFQLNWVSAGEGERFGKVVNEMYNKVAALGPLKLTDSAVKEETA